MDVVTYIAIILLFISVLLVVLMIQARGREYELCDIIRHLSKENAVLKAKINVLKLKQDEDYNIEIDEELNELIKEFMEDE